MHTYTKYDDISQSYRQVSKNGAKLVGPIRMSFGTTVLPGRVHGDAFDAREHRTARQNAVDGPNVSGHH